jgi:hypothetical protein
MMGRQLAEAESMERLSAEYLTLATLAQAERWDSLLSRSGLSDTELDAVRSSEAHGPLLAAFREAEAKGLDVEAAAFPRLTAQHGLDDAGDVAALLHGRVERWSQAARGRRRHSDNLIAGLIPLAQGVSDPDLARALSEREQAMEGRARNLAEQALEGQRGWVQRLGPPPSDPARRKRWMSEVSTVAAYRDRWHMAIGKSTGSAAAISTEQRVQQQRARAAADRATAISRAEINQSRTTQSTEVQMDVGRGAEL